MEDEVIARDEKLEEKVQAITGAIARQERQLKRMENVLGTLTEEEYCEEVDTIVWKLKTDLLRY